MKRADDDDDDDDDDARWQHLRLGDRVGWRSDYSIVYTMGSMKTCRSIFVRNCDKSLPIFKILSLLASAVA